MAITLTGTSKGQITLRREVLAHLGARPGDKLDVDLPADGRRQTRTRRGTLVEAVFGVLAKPQAPPLSIVEMNEIAASGWAGEA